MQKKIKFSKKSRLAPAKPKKQITIRIEDSVIRYFKTLAKQSGLPYQNLINLYLRDCLRHRRKPQFKWAL